MPAIPTPTSAIASFWPSACARPRASKRWSPTAGRKTRRLLKDVTAIVLHNRLGGTVLFRGPQRRQVEEMLKQGVGITAIHWGTGAETPEGGPWLQTMGGWFNAEGDGFSKYLVQTSKLRQADPKHPICRGWSDFDLREEFYFKLCFLPEARPVMSTIIEGKDYPIGWVYERRNSKGGRSFGFVGGHFHDNFGDKGFSPGCRKRHPVDGAH